MFLRLYLIGRVIMFHATINRNSASQSVGYLNRVSIGVSFVIKHYLELRPTSSLFMLATVVFMIGSWCFRACDYQPGTDHISFFDAMWFFVVTFKTVGKYFMNYVIN